MTSWAHGAFLPFMSTTEDLPSEISCTSYYWIYTATDVAGFEARRALSHLARGRNAGSVEFSSDSPGDTLAYVRAGRDLINNAAVALRDVVYDARRRGVTWATIAAELGIGETAAQKRFGRLPGPEDSGDLEKLDLGINAVILSNQAQDIPMDSRLPLDERDIAPEVFFRESAVNLVRKAIEYDNVVYQPYRQRIDSGGRFTMPEAWWNVLAQTASALRSRVWDLARSGAIGAIFEDGKYWPVTPCIDESPGLYLSYACFHAATSVGYLTSILEDLNGDDLSSFHRDIEMAFRHLRTMIEIFSRPECLAIIQVVNWSLSHADNEDDESSPPDGG